MNSYYFWSGYGLFYDSTYILVIIGIVLTMAASAFVNFRFNKYKKVRSRNGLTGAEVATKILRAYQLYDIKVVSTRGELSDYYSDRKKIIALSDSVYGKNSLASIGVAAHECGHAIQHSRSFIPAKIRSVIAPVSSFSGQIYWPVLLIGFFITGSSGDLLINIGLLLFSFTFLFRLVTLPVEIDASRRAIRVLDELRILDDEELKQAKKVLRAAALTYIAAIAASLLQLLRILMILGGRRRND